MNRTVTLALQRAHATRYEHMYEELREADEAPILGSIRVQKSFLGSPPPSELRLTVIWWSFDE